DSRSRGFDPQTLPGLIRSIEGVEAEILYLDSAGSELIRRYDETRRLHPLAPDRPAEDGIARERDLTAPLRNAADSVLDTTDLKPVELRDELRRRYGDGSDQPVITIARWPRQPRWPNGYSAPDLLRTCVPGTSPRRQATRSRDVPDAIARQAS